MNSVIRPLYSNLIGVVVAAVALAWGTSAQAHCDSIDGPVVSQARRALDTGNVNRVLGWVQDKDEAAIRAAFEHAVAVRNHGSAARDLADQSFLEALVRVHRAGDGAPYTGLRSAGQIESAVVAAENNAGSRH